jgi:signal transduction histidine kinase
MEVPAQSGYQLMPDPAARPAKLGARLVLWVGFGAVLALLVLSRLDSIRVLREIETGHARIMQGYLFGHHALDRVRSALYLAGGDVRDFILDPDPEVVAERLAHWASLEKETNSILDNYASYAGPGERELWVKLTLRVRAYWDTLAPISRWSPEERRVRGYSFLRSVVYPHRAAVLEMAADIDHLQEQALGADEKRSMELFSSYRRRATVLLALALSLGLVVAWLSIGRILRLERDARLRYQEIGRARGELEKLSARLVEAQEQERRVISRELHDEVGQSLSALLVELGNLTAIGACMESAEAIRLVVTIRKLAEDSVNAIRNMALLLRPSMLDDFGLVPALHWQAREVSRRTGIRVQVSEQDVADELPDAHKTCIYRVVQEALHNVARHAAARAVQIAVSQDPDRLRLTIRDDGKGFDPQRTRGLGLLGMEERVRHLKGRFSVESGPGQGTLLEIELPLVGRQELVTEPG